MKVLLTAYTAYPRIGGRSTVMNILKQCLEAAGHQVDILAHTPGLQEVYIVGGQRVQKYPLRKAVEAYLDRTLPFSFPDMTPWMRWRETERYTFEAAIRAMDLSAYDLIHTHDILSSLACQRAIENIPIVASFHNLKSKEWQVNDQDGCKPSIETRYVSREEYFSVSRPAYTLVPCEWLRASFIELGAEPSRLHVVPYGILLQDFQQKAAAETELIKKSGVPVLLCPARLVPIKGHRYLLRALERLQREGRTFVCWIAGNGVLEQELKEEVRRRNLTESVRFLGGRTDLPAVMRLADVVVLPTLHDTSPLVIMEAQLSGLPVISTDVGGVKDLLLDDPAGMVGPGADAEYLYRAISQFIAEPEKWSRRAQLFRSRAEERWSDKRLAEETLSWYRTAIESFRGNPHAQKELKLDEELLRAVFESGSNPPALTEQGSIDGKVYGGEASVPFTVHLLDISWVTLQTAKTDAQGHFSFEHVPPGAYAVMGTDGTRWNALHVQVRARERSICHLSL